MTIHQELIKARQIIDKYEHSKNQWLEPGVKAWMFDINLTPFEVEIISVNSFKRTVTFKKYEEIHTDFEITRIFESEKEINLILDAYLETRPEIKKEMGR